MASFFQQIRQALSFRSTGLGMMINIGQAEVYADIRAGNVINQGWANNTAVYSIITKDAKKFASIPRYLYDSQDKLVENELSKLLDHPNEDQGQDAFLELVRSYYKTTGEAFIFLNRGFNDPNIMDDEWSKRPVLEMFVLPSDQILLKPDPANLWGVLGYILEAGGSRVHLRKVDVIHWKNTSLFFDVSSRTHLRGFPPLSAGFKTLQQNNDATDSAVRMHKNDGSKGLLFNESNVKLDPKQKSDIKQVIDAKLNSSDTKGSIAVIEGKWNYVDLKSSIDLQLLESKKLTWQELCFLLDVPYEFFDTQTSFANKLQAQKGWVSNSIIPACNEFDDELERMLLPAFNMEDFEIRSDASGLPEMQEDMVKLADALSKLPLSVNEVREAAGYDIVVGEQYSLIPITVPKPISNVPTL